MARIARHAWTLFVLACIAGCRVGPPLPVIACTSDDDCPVGTLCDGASRRCVVVRADAGSPETDAGRTLDGGGPRCEPAEPCDAEGTCAVGTCATPSARRLGDVLGILDLPEGMPQPVVVLAPASLCRARSGCDLEAARTGAPDGCGSCGRCVFTAAGAACRPRCTADADCDAAGLVCDAALGACVEGCTSDALCRIARTDRGTAGRFDGTGVDRLAYDPASAASCVAGRCAQPGQPDVRVGAHCRLDSECGEGHVCITAARGWSDPTAPWAAGLDAEAFPEGFCTVVGCDGPGGGCNDGEVCIRRPSARLAGADDGLVSFCARSCPPGAEAAEDRLGPGGHGAGCDPGDACTPERDERTGALVGACFPGVYDEVTAPNVGRPCHDDDECWSPHGLGRCDPLVPWAPERYGARVCTVVGCDVLGDEVCGEGASCQLLDRATVPLCVRHCARAEDCMPGLACADADGSPDTPTACVGGCFSASECRDGEACEAGPGGVGRCVAAGECSTPIDLLSVAVERDGWLEVDRCRGLRPSAVAACGVPETTPSYAWTAPADGMLVLRGGPARLVLGTECAPRDERCLGGSDGAPRDPDPLAVREGKRVLVRAEIDSSSLSAAERCTSGPRASGVRTQTPLALRLARIGAEGDPCDPAAEEVVCGAALACFDPDGAGARCAPAPACDAPVPLDFATEDGLLVGVFEVDTAALGTGYRCESELVLPPLSSSPQRTYAFTAPRAGRLRASPWPHDPRGGTIDALSAPGRVALVDAPCDAAGALPAARCAREMPGGTAAIERDLRAGETVYLTVSTTHDVVTASLPLVGVVGRFDPSLEPGEPCERGGTFRCPPGHACWDPARTGAPSCAPPAALGELCDPTLASSACESGLLCPAPPLEARCVRAAPSTGTCGSPILFGTVALPPAGGAFPEWRVHEGGRSMGETRPVVRSCGGSANLMAPEVVYRVVPSSPGVLVARTDAFLTTPPVDTVLEAYADCGDPLTSLTCDDDDGDGNASLLSLTVEAGVPIDVVVDGYNATVPDPYLLAVRVFPPPLVRPLGTACDATGMTDVCAPPLRCWGTCAP